MLIVPFLRFCDADRVLLQQTATSGRAVHDVDTCHAEQNALVPKVMLASSGFQSTIVR